MFQRSKISTAALALLGGLSAVLAHAQEAQQLERVSITGSAIKRIDAETAVPVTVVKMDDLKKSGVTSVEQIMARLPGVQASMNAAQAIGSGTGGASFADMRGIGADKTLVLLNGQRLSNNAVDGSAPDLNMIPFAAIERIEVLRDGASSLYGTDAIGGVINFITRRDLQGGSITIGYDEPQKAGGKTQSANLGFGFGDISRDRFNVFGYASYKKQDSINGLQRDFNKRIVGGVSSSTDPANYIQDGLFYNPANATGCVGTAMIVVGTQCKLVTPSFVDFSPQSETASAMAKASFRASDSLELSLEAFAARNRVTTKVAPVPYGGYAMNPLMPNGQANPYFPKTNVNPNYTEEGVTGETFNAPSAAFPNPALVQPGFVYVFWRDNVNGPREQTNKNDQNRLLFTAEGNGLGWDYSASAAWNRSKVGQFLTGGYADGDMIGEGLLTGVINPFGAQSTAGTELLKKAALVGKLTSSTGTVTSLNVRASREFGDWLKAGRPVALAIGAEARREKFESRNEHDFAALVSASTGADPDYVAAGTRKVGAVFGELNVPLLKSLDLTASVRYDRYSDVGGTTNPKLSLRFQPMKELLVRGSLSTGFRAPTLYELHGGDAYTNTAGNYDNPINCPGGKPLDGLSQGANCDAQFQVLNGGNINLKPEKSKSATFGIVVEPIANLSLGADFWWVRIKDSISTIPQSTLFAEYANLQQYFHFAPGNTLSISSNCPGARCGYVDQHMLNLGGTNTNGIDLSAQSRLRSGYGLFDLSLASTYVMKYEYQDYAGGPWKRSVGVYSGNGPIFRWQHNLSLRWSKDQFGAGVSAQYKSGYVDFDPSNKVRPFTTVDLFGSWAPIKPLSLTVGVRNLFNQEPPFTNQTDLFQAGGWDSRFADATGRSYYARATYSF